LIPFLTSIFTALPVLASGVSAAIAEYQAHRKGLADIPPAASTWRADRDAARAELARREAAAQVVN
jgi:hypothetical protein